MKTITFFDIINYSYKQIFFNNFLFYKGVQDYFIKKIIFMTCLNITYAKKKHLNFNFLNYINVLYSLFGFYPLIKNVKISFYLISSKKKKIKKQLKFKKKNFSFLIFKFYIYLKLNNFIFFNFLKFFYLLLEFYKTNTIYFNLNFKNVEIKKFKNLYFINYHINNIHLLFNMFLSRFTENYIFKNDNKKFNFYLYFYKIKNLF